MAFSPAGKILASSGEDPSIQLWDVDTGKHLSTLSGHEQPVKVLAFSPNGKTLASAGVGGTIRLWNPYTGTHLRLLVQLGLTDTDQEFPRQGAWVDKLAFSPDGSTLTSGDHRGTVELWRVDDGKLLSTIKAHKSDQRIGILAG